MPGWTQPERPVSAQSYRITPVLPARVIELIESLRSIELAEIEPRWRHPHVPIGTRDDAEG